MNETAWRQLDWGTRDAEYWRVWDSFDGMFNFRPSTEPGLWPSIDEPTPSVTYDLSEAMTAKRLDGAEVAFGSALLRALQAVTQDEESVYALDWQHPAYAFTPSLESAPTGLWDWPVPAVPNGDYYIFVACDLSCGVFGHPWEQSWCVFGRTMIDTLEIPRDYQAPIIRRNGSPVP